ncbi:YgfZ/GcvT domain-containing protein [Kiloniella sp.]|uniref:CAF17-like 4Fe-4S cluster assembly/insertion protein YgfZ n=1 Tax=Kiloniella sp. TaxID=1938587 RepID=UPI003B02E148
MSDLRVIPLQHRTVLRLEGEELVPFLQGVVTQDVTKVTSEHSVWSALLTAQGKFLHEFFISLNPEGGFLLDCEKERASDLLRRLKLYKMRSKASLELTGDDYTVAVIIGDNVAQKFGLSPQKGASQAIQDATIYMDPRHLGLGARAIIASEKLSTFINDHELRPGTLEDYDSLRIPLGIPDGSRDLEVEKSILLENGFNELGAIDWDKGCYIGQELTARTKYRALIKKRLVPVSLTGPTPEIGSDITLNGKNVGILRSTYGQTGLATLRIDAIGSDQLLCQDANITPKMPDWIEIVS